MHDCIGELTRSSKVGVYGRVRRLLVKNTALLRDALERRAVCRSNSHTLRSPLRVASLLQISYWPCGAISFLARTASPTVAFPAAKRVVKSAKRKNRSTRLTWVEIPLAEGDNLYLDTFVVLYRKSRSGGDLASNTSAACDYDRALVVGPFDH